MLAQWRTALGIDTHRADSSVVRVDGIDLDAHIALRMRAWYLDLLDTAPLDRLELSDIAPAVTAHNEGRTLTAILPDVCRRVADIRLEGWERSVAPITDSRAETALAMAASPYAAPGCAEPVAVLSGRRLICCPGGTGRIASLRAVVDPGPETYILHESLLASIPGSINPYEL